MTEGINYKEMNKLVNKEDVNKIWNEYFEELLNIVDDSVANISAVGKAMIPMCQRCNVRIDYDEINGAVMKLKGANRLV